MLRFLPRALNIRIQGHVTNRMSEDLQLRLSVANQFDIKYVGLTLNCIGGSISTAQSLAEDIKEFANKKE